jgi:ribonucleoside-diphosphate reductase subunit M2
MPLSTPSKGVAASLEKFNITTPVKAPAFVSKSNHEPETEQQDANDASAESEQLDPSRLRFVGDVDLNEKDEPLLKVSQRRFVLFPIQYHEVCRVTSCIRRHSDASFRRSG